LLNNLNKSSKQIGICLDKVLKVGYTITSMKRFET